MDARYVHVEDRDEKECYERALRQSVTKIYEKYITDTFMENPDLIASERLKKAVDYLIAKQKNSPKAAKEYAWITINPNPDGLDNDEFHAKVHKCAKKKWVTDCMYVFEQRSETECTGVGLHAHMLIKRDGKVPSEIEREFRSTFKDMVGNNRHIYIRYIGEEAAMQKVEYMKGLKATEKLEKCKMDQEYRKVNDLKPYYVRGVKFQ